MTWRTSLSRFLSSERGRKLHTAARFLVVGGLSTVVTIGLFNVLVHVGDFPVLASRPITGYALAMLAGLAVNYAGNRFWVFGGTSTGSRWAEVVGFVITNAVAVAIPSVCLAISRYVLGLDSAWADNVSANGVGLVLATLSRWLAYRYFVFSPPASTDDDRGIDQPTSERTL